MAGNPNFPTTLDEKYRESILSKIYTAVLWGK
jgi:hypothetical protein